MVNYRLLLAYGLTFIFPREFASFQSKFPSKLNRVEVRRLTFPNELSLDRPPSLLLRYGDLGEAPCLPIHFPLNSPL